MQHVPKYYVTGKGDLT